MEGGLLLSALLVAAFASAACESCENIFVRWARVKYGQAGRVSGSYSRKDCQEACLNNRHPSPTFRDYSAVECGGFNHRQGQNSLMHDCEIFQPSQLEFLDNSAVADDRYSFYRKLCVPTASRSCQSHYHFSYVPDQYMDPATAVSKTIQGISVEACLGLCLGGAEASLSFSCRSASYNRSSSLCLLSPHSAQSQPRAYRSNQDPNFRIDYYESNCYSNSYAFSHKCTERGFEVSVTSRQPYTGVLYGLYDYFTCRLEPVAKKDFSYLFPFPERSSSCTDSISRRRGGKEYVLEVVLDTDSVEPAYYLTADDLTYQAVCPVPDSAHNASRISASVEFRPASDFHKAHRSGVALRNVEAAVLPRIDDAAQRRQRKEDAETKEGSKISIELAHSAKRKLAASTIHPPPTTQLPERNETSATVPVHWNPETTAKTELPVDGRSKLTSSLPSQPSLATTTTPTSSTTSRSTTTTMQTRPTRIMDRLIASGILQIMETKGYRTPHPRFTAPVSTDSVPTTLKPQTTTIPSTTTKPTLATTTTTSTSTTVTQPSTLPTSSSSHTSTARSTRTTRLQFGSTTSAGTRLRIKGPTKTIQKSTRPERPTPKWERYWRTSSTTPRPVISTTTSPTTTATTRGAPTTRAAVATERISVETRREASTGANESVLEPILFDIFLGGRRAEAVVVGSGVTLSFTPSLPLPSGHLSLVGCQVEPVGSAEAVLLWEREEPLVLLADSCPADAVGLVCVPERTNFGIRVRTEAFRYQSTSQIQYTCLLRVCAHSPCPQPVCQAVDGCPAQRRRRQSGFLQSSSSLANRFGSPALPSLIRRPFAPSLTHSSGPDQANLARLAGDHVVKKSFVIVNDENELAYFIRTGKVPRKATPAPPVPVPSNPLTNPFFQHLPRQSQQGFWGFG